MMTYEFRALFEVTFPHAYYDTNMVEGLLIQPSPSAAKVMSGQNFLFRNKPGGFFVLAQIRKQVDGSASAGALRPGVSLAFYLKVENSVFYQVTKIPAAKGMILYATNFSSSTSLKTGIKAGEWQLLPFRSTIWKYNLVDAVGQAGFGYGASLKALKAGGGLLVSSYCLKDLTGEVVWESDTPVVLRQLSINCTGLPEGYYSLLVTIEDKQTLPEYRFVHINDISSSSTLGMYEWFPQSRSGKSDGLLPMGQSYQVAFNNVESLWRYYIILAGGIQPDSLSLVCDQVNGVAADFSVGLPAKTPDNRDATVFTSKQNIPLKQSPTGGVAIRLSSNGELNPIRYPSPGYEEETKRTKSQTVSNVYVYL